MRKNKKQSNLPTANHSRCPSTQKLRNSQPRLSVNLSPRKALYKNISSHFLTNPSSL